MHRICWLAGLWLCVAVLPAQAQDASALVGLWESRDQAGLAIELRSDGNGLAYQTQDESFPLTWSVDTEAEPARLELTINGQTRVSLVRFDAPDSISLTEPRPQAPEDFDGIAIMRLDRVGNGG